jgi:abortive infection bacteriophage resistance protein
MSEKKYDKQPLNYNEQILRLQSRGLIIESHEKAVHILKNISYYRMSGYWHPFLAEPKSSHQFKEGTTFNGAFNIYCFDRELRTLILNEIEKIEVGIRAQLIYQLSHSKGAFWYNESNNFKNSNTFEKSIEKLNKEFTKSDEEFILSFKSKYSNPMPPSWMMLEISSFGNLSNLYSNLRPGLTKRQIAEHFGLDDSTFASWIHALVYIRNLCAHHARLWNRLYSIRAQVPNNPRNPFLKSTYFLDENGDKNYFNKKTYFVLSMIIYLLNTVNPKHTFQSKFHQLLNKFPMIDLKAMGFPEGWENEVLWDWDNCENT